MTVKQSEEIRHSVEEVIEPLHQKFARWIEDPFASALLATASVALAVTLVLTGMGIISLLLG